jgi:hypothetical protein
VVNNTEAIINPVVCKRSCDGTKHGLMVVVFLTLLDMAVIMKTHLKKLLIHTYRVKQRNLYIKSRLSLAD